MRRQSDSLIVVAEEEDDEAETPQAAVETTALLPTKASSKATYDDDDEKKNKTTSSPLSQSWELFAAATPTLGVLWALSAATGVVCKVADNFVLLYLVDELKASVPQFAVANAAESVAALLVLSPACPSYPTLVDTFGRPVLLALSIFVAVLRIVVIVVWPTLDGVILSGACYGASWIYSFLIIPEVAAEHAPTPLLAPTSVALCSAFYFGLGGVLGSAIGACLQIFFGWHAFFKALLAVGFLAALLACVFIYLDRAHVSASASASASGGGLLSTVAPRQTNAAASSRCRSRSRPDVQPPSPDTRSESTL